MCISELQDLEPSAGPAVVHQLPATKGQVQQTAADIHSQLEVRSAFSAVTECEINQRLLIRSTQAGVSWARQVELVRCV